MKYLIKHTIPLYEQDVLNEYGAKGYKLVQAIVINEKDIKLYFAKDDNGED